jgi:glycerol-3-phosphate dehydrogenase
MDEVYDLAVIGGGINGCGIARDASGRGASVYLCEMDDLASATSSWSTKLVHGGLRYLEYYEFRLVQEALKEREVLWSIAPHIVAPLRFVLPHHKGLRPAWLLRLGLFFYDHLGGRKLLPSTRSLNLTTDTAGRPLKSGMFTKGFEYSDCRVDDARLTVLNAMAAREAGATIETRTRAVAARRVGSGWELDVQNLKTGQIRTLRAKVLINAAGPWVTNVLAECGDAKTKAKVRLVQGSHIVVRKLFDHDRAYIFQNTDGRIIFAIPYRGDFTLIGTTDRDYQGDPAKVHATAEEIDYLCRSANEYFSRQISPGDVVWSYSGVRPLYDDGASEAKAATRDYVLELDTGAGAAPLLSIFGGKITTYRKLAEAALDKITPYLPILADKAGWTGRTALPGGDFPVSGIDDMTTRLLAAYPFLEPAHARRLILTYGSHAGDLLGTARTLDDLGPSFGGTLTEAEIRYLVDREWARSTTDILWRRTKLGLVLTADEVARLTGFMAEFMNETGAQVCVAEGSAA